MNFNQLRILFFLLTFIYTPTTYSSAPIPIEDFLLESTLRDVEISPTGRYLASVWNKGIERTVLVQDLENDSKVIAKFGSKTIRPNWVEWANDDRLLVFLRIPYRQEMLEKKIKKNKKFDIYEYPKFSRVMAVDPDGKNEVILLSDDRRLINNRYLSSIHHFLPDDPEHIYMNSFSNERLALYKVNVYTGESEKIESGTLKTREFISDKQGNLKYRYDWLRNSRAIQIYDYNEKNQWVKSERIELESDLTKEVSPDDMVGYFGEDTIAYRKRNKETGFYELISRHRDGSEEVIASEPDKDILNVILGNAGEIIAYKVEEDDVIRIRYFNQEKQKIYDRVKKKVEEFGSSGFSLYSLYWKSAGQIVVKTSGRDDAGIFHLYDRKEDKLTLFDLVHPEWDPVNLGIPAVVTYAARDGLQIKGFMLLPPEYEQGKRYPMVLLPHGGPQWRDYAYFDVFAQFIASRGYVVLQPNFRGSTGYGKDFEEAGYKQWGLAMQEDLEDGVKFAIEQGFAKKDKVCIVGAAYGGYAALIGATQTEKMFRCAISMNGVTDIASLVDYQVDKFQEHPRLLEKIYRATGHPIEDKEYLKQQSPINKISEIHTPILLIGGTKDQVVPFKQQKSLYKKLKSAKKDIEFLRVERAGHNVIYYRDHREEVYTEIERFLAKHLQSGE